ncbi:hypothetical protein F511_37005 [Dorcoceras hygrometricum]|uniref:Uncharacterized protein n=1 Tax=Dorcoceras hygrometricum TaxID=472368 RepID=A0A2Z7B7J9_9LAMI|nr:hypothetical protein F511_37005 [Dorcoceras hygrometricum]
MINSLMCFGHGKFIGLRFGSGRSGGGPRLGGGGSTAWSSQSRDVMAASSEQCLVAALMCFGRTIQTMVRAVAQPRIPTRPVGGPADGAPAKGGRNSVVKRFDAGLFNSPSKRRMLIRSRLEEGSIRSKYAQCSATDFSNNSTTNFEWIISRLIISSDTLSQPLSSYHIQSLLVPQWVSFTRLCSSHLSREQSPLIKLGYPRLHLLMNSLEHLCTVLQDWSGPPVLVTAMVARGRSAESELESVRTLGHNVVQQHVFNLHILFLVGRLERDPSQQNAMLISPIALAGRFAKQEIPSDGSWNDLNKKLLRNYHLHS